MSELTFFDKTRIQMEYVVPLINELKEVLGEETVLDALDKVSKLRLERTDKKEEADFSQMNEMVEIYAAGSALEYDVIASSADLFDVDVHVCRYAEMMEQLGGRDFGHLLICSGDFISAKGFIRHLCGSRQRDIGSNHHNESTRPS